VTRLIAFAALIAICSTAPVSAQGRATGTVKDTGGRPIKGATVRAVNRDMYPPEFASTSDDKGRWVMLGLRVGTWTFMVEAPGFIPVQAPSLVRVASTAPLAFVLARDPGPIPGALDRNVVQDVTAANQLRDRGQYEQALAAYQRIRDQNPKLTSLSLVVAGVYRKQAAAETDPTARRAFLDRAISTYSQLLSDDANGARAKAELETTRAEVQALPR